MGNDGGSIPSRVELVKQAQKAATTTEVKAAERERLEYGWTTDPLSRRPLVAPIVADSAGVMYCKESVIEYLLKLAEEQLSGPNGDEPDGDDQPGGIRLADAKSVVQTRIRSLKDVVELKFEDQQSSERAGGSEPVGPSSTNWICPVSRKELGPTTKAVYVVPCGHVFAAAAMRELESATGGKCLQCDSDYQTVNVIPILSSDRVDIQFLALRSATLAENRLTHSLKSTEKKKKKSKKRTRDEEPADMGVTDPPSKHRAPGAAKPARLGATINNPDTAAVTARVLREQQAMLKHREATQSTAVASIFTSAADQSRAKTSSDFMTRGFSISK